LAAGPAPKEATLEARIARHEADVAHLRTDVADIKVDVRTLRDKIDALKDSVAAAQVWALVLYIAFAAGVFGTMARGFGWI
jgi:phage shock protein A